MSQVNDNSAQAYCESIAGQSGSSFYYSFLFLTPLQKQAICAIYAFCKTIDDIVDNAQDRDLAKRKLDWWQEEIHKVFNPSPTQPLSHPIAIAIQQHRTQFDFKLPYFLDLLQGMQMDLMYQQYATISDLEQYCYNVASTVGLLSIEIFGYENQSTLLFAKKLGLCLQWINIIRDVGEDALRGRIYLPTAELEQYKVSPQDILDLKYSDNFKKLLTAQAQRAENLYQEAMNHLAPADRFNQKTALIMAHIYLKLLDKIKNNEFKTLNQSISLWPIQKLWLAWKTHRYETKLHHSGRRLERT